MADASTPGSPGHTNGEPQTQIDAGLLEQAWQQHVASRQTFARELAIGFVAIILLTATFIRSVDVFDKMELNQARLQDTYVQQAGHRNTRLNQLSLLPLTFLSGQKHVAEVIQAVPCAAEERLLALRSEIAGEDITHPILRATTCTELVGATYPSNLVSRITDSERSTLVSPSRSHITIADDLLAREVLRPLSEAVQDSKDHALDEPVANVVAELKKTVEQQRAVVETGTGEGLAEPFLFSSELLDQFAAGVDEAPVSLLSPHRGNDEVLIESLLAASRYPSETIEQYFLRTRQMSLAGALALVETTMTIEQSSEPLVAALLEQQSDLNLQSKLTSQIYAGPLPGTVSLSAVETVRLFPLVLAMVLAFFTWRYIQLRNRAVVLSEAFQSQGRSKYERDLFLPGLGRAGPTSGKPRAQHMTDLANDVVGIVCILVTGAAILFTGLTSLSFPDTSGGSLWLWLLYLLAALLVVWAYIVLGVEFFSASEPDQVSSRASRFPRFVAVYRVIGSLGTRISPTGKRLAISFVLVLSLIATVVLSVGAFAVAKRGSSLFGSQQPLSGSISLVKERETTLESFLGLDRERSPERFSMVRVAEGSRLQNRWDLLLLADPALNGLVGKELSLRVDTAGYAGEELTLRWSLLSAAEGQPPVGPFFINQPAFPTSKIVPRVNSRSSPLRIWVPYPPYPGQYNVAITLAQVNGIVIAVEVADLVVPATREAQEPSGPTLIGLSEPFLAPEAAG